MCFCHTKTACPACGEEFIRNSLFLNNSNYICISIRAMNKTKNRNTRINCRLSFEEKKRLSATAAQNGMDLSELIRLRLKDLPIANQKLKNDFFTVMLELTAEINKIGVNINQITAGYNKHLLCMEFESASGSIKEFNRLFKIYQASIDRLYFQIEELLHNE
jgi:hypothetical protein